MGIKKNTRKMTDVRKLKYIKHVNRENHYVQPAHRHGRFLHELVYLDNGQMEVFFGERRFFLKTGECILIHGGIRHVFSGKGNSPFSYLNITFRGSVIPSLFGTVLAVSQEARQCMENLVENAHCITPFRDELVMCRFTEFLLLLSQSYQMRELPKKDLPVLPSDQICRYRSKLVGKAVEIIRSKYNQQLDMESLSEMLCISKSHLRALLRQETGKNFTALQHEARINAAKRLILESGMNLNEIATAVGYNSSFFFRVFKQVAGMTPHAYSSMLKGHTFTAEIYYEDNS